jgi:transcriptional regulator with XRE-family HTH domain
MNTLTTWLNPTDFGLVSRSVIPELLRDLQRERDKCERTAACYHPPMPRDPLRPPSRSGGADPNRLVRLVLGAIRAGREEIGWSPSELARRVGLSASTVPRIENRRLDGLSVATAGRILEELGVAFEFRPAFVADPPQQRDAAHARCSAYVRRRLEGRGWEVAQEVEVGSARSRGWIDVLAFERSRGAVLVVEIKTELMNVGAVQRNMSWYEREAWGAAKRQRWHPRRVTGLVLLLATEANEGSIRANRELMKQWCPVRAIEMDGWLRDPEAMPRARALALIDPASRRRRWLLPAAIDGRRTRSPYVNYADFMRRSTGPRRKH